MNNTVLRSLIIYAVCVPLAIFIGYLLSDPMKYSTMAILGLVGFVLAFPLVVRWHYPLLLLTWGMPCILIFIKGQPHVWLAMGLLTLGISILERALTRESQFIHVKQIMWPLLCLVGVVFVTAKLTGGFGLRALGSEVYGGKKYIFLIAGILSYFALTTRKIPPEKARFYVGLFFIGGMTNFIGDMYLVTPSWMESIYWFFPPTGYGYWGEGFKLGSTRMSGISATGMAIYFFMMALYGIRGTFLSGRPFRTMAFLVGFVLIFFGGFRSGFLVLVSTFIIQFYLEGLHRTKLLPVLFLGAILACALMVPFASRLPFTFQRTLAIVPGLELDPKARMDAEGSSEWRKQMWTALLPQVGHYFFLGKGYAITMADFQMMGVDSAFSSGNVDASQQGLALSGDYHNGPLSVIIPFGIWGVIAFFWFAFAGLRVVYLNMRHGDPPLRIINYALFANYLVLLLIFIFIGGGMSNDVARFIGPLGLSIALNGGVRRPERKSELTEPERTPNFQPHLRPSYQR